MSHSKIICVTGAGGFIGAHLLPALSGAGRTIRVLSRSAERQFEGGVETHAGNLLDRNSLISFLVGADLLINLAHPAESVSDEEFLRAISNLAIMAREAEVKRVVHVSTAMVVGVPQGDVVDERAALHPVTAYEKRKCLAEEVFLSELSSVSDIAVLRPTAVFGRGSLNLLKLSSTIADGSAWRRQVLRFLHGTRHMHLVSVEDVVAAICFLAFIERPLSGNVFLVSADEEPNNNYQSVDSRLGQVMGKPGFKMKLALPRWILKRILAVTGRSQSNPQLVFDASKLKSWGFVAPAVFDEKLAEFAESYMAERSRM